MVDDPFWPRRTSPTSRPIRCHADRATVAAHDDRHRAHRPRAGHEGAHASRPTAAPAKPKAPSQWAPLARHPAAPHGLVESHRTVSRRLARENNEEAATAMALLAFQGAGYTPARRFARRRSRRSSAAAGSSCSKQHGQRRQILPRRASSNHSSTRRPVHDRALRTVTR